MTAPAAKPRVTARAVVIGAILLTAIVLAGWSAGQLRRLLDRADVVGQLTRLGARVHWDCKLFENGEVYCVTDVHLDRQNFPDAGLALLQHLTHCKCVQLRGPRYTDDCLEFIAETPHLRYLVLRDTKVTPEGIARFQARKPGVEVYSHDSTAKK